MNYFKKIMGEKVYLSPINIDDYEKYTEWLNDPEVYINLTIGNHIITKGSEREALEKLISDNNNFAIIDLKNDELIGNCGLVNPDPVNRRAEIGIFIGDKRYWNKEYGREAVSLLLDFCFNIRNFNSVMLVVKEYNKRAIRCYEKCGFKKIGSRREACILGSEKYDEIFMDILASEFKGTLIGKLSGLTHPDLR